jgi:hypothetical protein
VQIDATLYDHQTETRAWAVTDVVAAVEGVEEPFSICFRNSDALVADDAEHFLSSTTL